jgi:ribosomal protein L5
MLRMKERYKQEVVAALMEEFKYSSVMQAPCVTKVVVNVGVGEALNDAKALDNASRDISVITGQRPADAGAQIHCEFQVARGAGGWRQGDVARPAHV